MEYKNLKKQKKVIPDTPGVYFFKNTKGEILYVGKATSLRSRIRSYFGKDLFARRGPTTEKMVHEATRVDFLETDSVLEALLLEARLIKKFSPKYNIAQKDDKSYNFVILTKEDFPRVILIREMELPLFESEIHSLFGPFPHGLQLKEGMRIIRKIFPFRDTCAVPKQNGEKGRPCFNAQIGLCPSVCSGEMTKKEYSKTIRNIVLFFEGKKKILIRSLEKDMKTAAKNLDFEKAGKLKHTLFSLQHIRDIALLKRDVVQRESGFRIEAYDIAHLGGTNTVGVMTVVEGGVPVKSAYRKFKIQGKNGADDVRNLKEVLSRRLSHPEWPYPKLIVIDGGRAQKNGAEKILEEAGNKISVVSVVKDDRHRPKNILGEKTLIQKYETDIVLANSEAHRFAVTYHKLLRGKL